MKIVVALMVFSFALLFVLFETHGQPADSKSLPNFAKVNDKLYRGAEPKKEGIAELKALGIKTVIDMGHGIEDSKEERSWVESAGMKYINIHLHNWMKSKPEDIDAILKEVESAGNQPVFLHCKRGSDRTGSVVAIYRMKNDGWLPNQAIDEAKTYGMGWWQIWMKDFVNDYYRDRIAKQKKIN
jgi:protein tyrosine/serine phosphatase